MDLRILVANFRNAETLPTNRDQGKPIELIEYRPHMWLRSSADAGIGIVQHLTTSYSKFLIAAMPTGVWSMLGC